MGRRKGRWTSNSSSGGNQNSPRLITEQNSPRPRINNRCSSSTSEPATIFRHRECRLLRPSARRLNHLTSRDLARTVRPLTPSNRRSSASLNLSPQSQMAVVSRRARRVMSAVARAQPLTYPPFRASEQSNVGSESAVVVNSCCRSLTACVTSITSAVAGCCVGIVAIVAGCCTAVTDCLCPCIPRRTVVVA